MTGGLVPKQVPLPLVGKEIKDPGPVVSKGPSATVKTVMSRMKQTVSAHKHNEQSQCITNDDSEAGPVRSPGDTGMPSDNSKGLEWDTTRTARDDDDF